MPAEMRHSSLSEDQEHFAVGQSTLLHSRVRGHFELQRRVPWIARGKQGLPGRAPLASSETISRPMQAVNEPGRATPLSATETRPDRATRDHPPITENPLPPHAGARIKRDNARFVRSRWLLPRNRNHKPHRWHLSRSSSGSHGSCPSGAKYGVPSSRRPTKPPSILACTHRIIAAPLERTSARRMVAASATQPARRTEKPVRVDEIDGPCDRHRRDVRTPTVLRLHPTAPPATSAGAPQTPGRHRVRPRSGKRLPYRSSVHVIVARNDDRGSRPGAPPGGGARPPLP